MLGRLKEAHYRRRYGSERAALILRVEREIDGLSREAVTREWTAWLWRLPPEAWLEAVALRKGQIELAAQREIAVRAIGRKHKLGSRLERLETPESGVDRERTAAELETATAEVERIKVEVRALERDVRVRALDLDERFSLPREDAKGNERLRPTKAVDRKADRWQAWLRTVPPERRDEALRVRALDADLDRSREKLIEAITQKNKLATEGAEESEVDRAKRLIQALKEERDRLDATYRRLAPALFEAVGAPDLTECVRG